MQRFDAKDSARSHLLERRKALQTTLESGLGTLGDSSSAISSDVVDAALDACYDELNSQLAQVGSREIERIECALDALQNGTYGICEGCNQAIPKKRLEFLPYATHCVDCQRQLEEQGDQLGNDASWRNVDETSEEKLGPRTRVAIQGVW